LFYNISKPNEFVDKANTLLEIKLDDKQLDKIQSYFDKRSSLAEITDRIDELVKD